MKTLAGPSKNVQRSALKISVLAPIAQRDWRRVGPPLPPPPAALVSRSRCVVLGSTFKIARLLLYSDGGGRQFDLARACARSSVRIHSNPLLPPKGKPRFSKLLTFKASHTWGAKFFSSNHFIKDIKDIFFVT